MKATPSLSRAFGPDFERLIADFSVKQGLLPEISAIDSRRFLSRSILPHVQRLSSLFNRLDVTPGEKQRQEKPGQETDRKISPYWKRSSHPENLRLAYFLYFMPCNLFRMASIWGELHRLGFRWMHKSLNGIEFGAGPATGICGIAAGEADGSVGLPKQGSWALIEQDKAMLELGAQWAKSYFSYLKMDEWETRSYHRKISLDDGGFLPRNAPSFNLWLMSFYLNELGQDPKEIAPKLLQALAAHLEEEGVVIIVEPALKEQSRKLLELRKQLLHECRDRKVTWLKVLLPCLGHQICGALENPQDWCHEEVEWWRPPYLQKIDKLAGLDHKTLPFSYLVLTRSERTLEEILPKLAQSRAEKRYRLVSPAHREGRDLEFFVCGQDGKKRTRFRAKEPLERGDILVDVEIRGDQKASRIDKASSIS